MGFDVKAIAIAFCLVDEAADSTESTQYGFVGYGDALTRGWLGRSRLP